MVRTMPCGRRTIRIRPRPGRRSQDFINETFNELSATDRRKIVHDTAAKLYNMEV